MADIPAFDGARPVVLVTLGTVVDDLTLLNAAVRGVLDAGADPLVTTGFTTAPEAVEGDPGRVRAVPFAPIGQLLDRVQAVVAAGGSGTTLATLSRGLPMAFVPRIANQPIVAAAVTDFGAGVVSGENSAAVTSAIRRVLHEPGPRTQAQAASQRLGQRPSPDEVWSALRDRVPHPTSVGRTASARTSTLVRGGGTRSSPLSGYLVLPAQPRPTTAVSPGREKPPQVAQASAIAVVAGGRGVVPRPGVAVVMGSLPNSAEVGGYWVFLSDPHLQDKSPHY
ncbi:nucleotide disphospho-sugar-binding domain-containing protein [Streptomyces sp. NPDC096323]|uniref:glycosyltransferase n=1 Tax=Streptomyces sp. NPDC096323 TaxID=3155822 RepID=UPI00332C8764